MSVWTDISGYENLLIYSKIFGVPQNEREAHRGTIEMMNLARFKDDLVRTYSGGMIRRLEIACALLVKPRIMFLDEPTIGLDPSARRSIREKLRIYRKEKRITIFFNTHYMDEADLYADEIAMISRGELVVRGTSDTFKRSLGGETIAIRSRRDLKMRSFRS